VKHSTAERPLRLTCYTLASCCTGRTRRKPQMPRCRLRRSAGCKTQQQPDRATLSWYFRLSRRQDLNPCPLTPGACNLAIPPTISRDRVDLQHGHAGEQPERVRLDRSGHPGRDLLRHGGMVSRRVSARSAATGEKGSDALHRTFAVAVGAVLLGEPPGSLTTSTCRRWSSGRTPTRHPKRPLAR
jgi:hypothetical protein